MRTLLPLVTLTLLANGVFAGDPPAATPATKPYPLDVCIVSGMKLGDMGAPVVIEQDGQEMKFCCKGCVTKFTKDPATYLKKLADAAPPATKAQDKAEAGQMAMPGMEGHLPPPQH